MVAPECRTRRSAQHEGVRSIGWLGVTGILVLKDRYFMFECVTGYWFNLVIVGAADIGLIIFLLAPGYMAIADGIPGPALWQYFPIPT
jgi:hypothetical protein